MVRGVSASNEGLDDHDPDAPWRPDFDGWEEVPRRDDAAPPPRVETRDVELEAWSQAHDQAEPEPWVPVRPVRRPISPSEPPGPPLATVEGLPTSAATGQVVLAGLGVAVAVLIVVGAVALLRPPDQVVSILSDAPAVPRSVDRAWSVTVQGDVGDVGIGPDELVIGGADGLTAFELEDGSVRWRRPPDGDREVEQVAVIHGVVVVRERGPQNASSARSLDRLTGDELWQSDDDGNYTISGTDNAPMLVRRTRLDDSTLLEFIDPVVGAVVGEPLRLSPVAAAGRNLAIQPGDRRVAVWSIDRSEVVAGPVDAFNLRTVAPLAGSIVALDLEGRIAAYDRAGRRVDEQPFVSDALGEFTGRAELAGVVEDAGIGIVASGSSIGFTVADGSIETVWRRTGRVLTPVETERGALSILIGPTEGTGEIRESIIDPVDGTTIVVTDPDGKRERPPVLGVDGYVLAPEVGAAERIVEAFDYDGDPLWSLSLPADGAYDVVRGMVVTVQRSADASTVDVAR